jgi:hypothetical protein
MIVIRCPNANQEVATGVVVDIATFAGLPRGQATLHCPACGQEHRWSVADAMLTTHAAESASSADTPDRT